MKFWRSLARLAGFAWPLYVTSGLLASVMFYLVPLLPGLVVKRIFDRLAVSAAGGSAAVPAAGGVETNGLLWLAAAIAGIGVMRFTSLLGASAAEQSLRQVVATLLRANVFEHILGRPGARPLPSSTGEAISRLRGDVEAIPAFLSWTLDPIGQSFAIGTALVVLWRVDPRLTLAVFGPLLATVMLVNVLGGRIRRLRLASRQSEGNVTGLIGEIVGGVLAVKVAGAEARVIAHFRALNAERRRAVLRDTALSRGIEALTYNISSLGVGLLLVLVALRLRAQPGTFAVGDFALFVSYLEWVTVITSMFGQYLTNFRQTDVSLKRLADLVDDPAPDRVLTRHRPVHLWRPLPELVEAPRTDDDDLATLTARGLSFVWPDGARAIDGVDLTIRGGTVTVITGPIGAGKTTLLRVLLGLLPAESGAIHWNGRPVDDPAAWFVPPRAAYTPQTPRLFSDTLRDNLLLGLARDDAALAEALARAVFDADVEAMPDGLDTRIGPRGTRLSGGQAQRAAAARMHLRTPSLLVFDDLSSALDVETEARLWDRLFAIPRRTVLAVAHRRGALGRADQVVVVDGGRVVAVGTVAELLAESEVFRRLWVTSLSPAPTTPRTR
ncbi:MAG: ABC transporter ATP-binding protein [Ardenticatenales bacterium]